MTTVPPPNPALPQMLAAAAASQPTATIVAPAPVIAALTSGRDLAGVVTAGPDPRVAVLATAAGPVPLRTPVPLPDGAAVTLEIVRATPQQITVRLLTIDGQPAQLALQSGAGAPSANTANAPSPPAPVPTTAAPLPAAPGTPAPLAPGFAWWPGGAQPATAMPPVSAVVLSTAEIQVAPTAEDSGAAPDSPLPGPTAPGQGASIPALGQPGSTSANALAALIRGAELTIRISEIALPAPGTDAQVTAISATPAVVAEAIEPLAGRPLSDGMPPLGPASVGNPPASVALVLEPAATATLVPSAATPPTTTVVEPSAAPAPMSPVTGQPAGIGPAALQPNVPVAILAPGAAPQIVAPAPDAAPGLVLPRPDTPWPATPAPPQSVVPEAPLTTVTAPVVRVLEGAPVVQIGTAEVQLNLRANLPVGTQVTLELRAVQPPLVELAAPPPPAPALVPLSLAQPGWPTLAESLQLLQRTDPAAAQQLANAIPDGGPRTAAALMSIVQALRTGEPRQWPGDATLRALERSGPRGAHLAAQLGAEVADLSRQVRETGSEWRALPLPWMQDGRVERVRMVVRETDAEDGGGKGKGDGGVRFLIDLDLSRLGRLQLDGMIKKQTRQFDLAIRTLAALPEELRLELMGVFAASNAAMNLAGGLTFQVVRKFPDPAASAPAQDKSGLWV